MDTYDEKFFQRAERIANTNVILGGLIGFMLGSGITFHYLDKQNNNNKENFLEKVQTIYNSKDIKKDTFKVEDITDDNKADIILYKKDGSKVVIDLAKQNILQETTKLDIIQ